ncbi:MAG TPA: alpha/beta hydrolase [Alphaproteobacteria bacterium]|nr:alpha/beta hydrolase [Alphaproteobacteria bacterium]
MRVMTLVFCVLLTVMALPGRAQSAEAPAVELKDNFVEANGLRFHYVSTGDQKAPMILMLHGYPSFWYQWKDQLLDFGRDHFAVAPDLRGYDLTTIPKGVDQYKMKYLVEDVRDFAEKVGGKGRKFVLVGHDWGGLLAWVFAMYHPEMIDKLIIVNAPHPMIFEREMNDNPVQRFGSNYTFAFNNYDAKKWDEMMSANNFAPLIQGILGEQIKSGRYTDEDVQKWVAAWKVPGALDAGLNYYRANHLNPPFNETHPASSIPTHWSAKEVTEGAKSTIIKTPTLVIWGLKDTALQTGNLSGMEKLVPNIRFRLYPNDTHWVSISKSKETTQDMRDFIEGKDMPHESVAH